jgi:multiple sugar transport system permease protein
VIAIASLIMAPIFQKQLNDQFLLGARNQAFVTEHIAGFETVKTLTEGGPNKASEVLLFTIYQEGFVYLRVGYASAMTVVFLLILVVLMFLQYRVLDRRVHYT